MPNLGLKSKEDEDFLEWARRAMRYAHAKHYPGNRFKRSLGK